MRKIMIAAAALALPACTNTGMSDTGWNTDTTEATYTATTPARYVAMAGASDMYEIQSSRLALERSSDRQVQQFARMMIDDHQGTTTKVMTAARKTGLDPAPPQLMPTQRDMIDELRGLDDAAFDRAYWSQQQRAHQMALALHSHYAEQGSSEELRQAASAAVPIIERHIRHLREMTGTSS